MSPVHDPRFSNRLAKRDKEREAAARAHRMEYIKPLVMLGLGAGIIMGMLHSQGGSELAMVYPIRIAIQLVFGVAGLWVAAKLWLGGVGPLGLGILRLAGIYAITDLVALVAAPLMILGWFIHIILYVCLLAWLFDLEFSDSIIVAVITFLLKIVASAAVMMMMT